MTAEHSAIRYIPRSIIYALGRVRVEKLGLLKQRNQSKNPIFRISVFSAR
jgi:hypothetical protein